MAKYLPLAIVPLALILWSLFGAAQLASISFKSLVNYQTPYAEPLPPARDGDSLTAQLVLLIASGLRLDQSQQMNNLNALRARGADRVLRVGMPSYSLPGWSVIGTGAWQEQHGQTTDLDARPLPLDSIFLAARRKGLKTALTGSPSWGVLFKDQVDTLMTEPDPPDALGQIDAVREHDDAVEANALKMLQTNIPNLLVVQFAEPDAAYRAFGVFSSEGVRARVNVDARLGRLLQAMDLNKTTVIFTSDHGHIDRGGAGGTEDSVVNVPFVAADAAIKPGTYPPANQVDIAPTAALLLGTGVPSHSLGDVLDDMLEMPLDPRAQRHVDWAMQVVTRADSIAKTIAVGSIDHPQLVEAQRSLAAGNDEAAIHAARAEAQSTRDALSAFREGRLQTERLVRTPVFLLLLLPLALYVWFMRLMAWDFARPLLASVIFFLVSYGLFFAQGQSFSLSTTAAPADLMAWFTARSLDAVVALLISAIVAGLVSRRTTRFEALQLLVNTSFLIFAALWFQICIYYWLNDFTSHWYLPDQALTVMYYLNTLQSGAFILQNPFVPTILITPFFTLGAKWLVDRIR